jgi:hypothetical protein
MLSDRIEARALTTKATGVRKALGDIRNREIALTWLLIIKIDTAQINKILARIYADLAANQRPLGAEFEKALSDNIEDLYEE